MKHSDPQWQRDGVKQEGRKMRQDNGATPEVRVSGPIDPNYDAEAMQKARDRNAPPADPLTSTDDPKGLKRRKG